MSKKFKVELLQHHVRCFSVDVEAESATEAANKAERLKDSDWTDLGYQNQKSYNLHVIDEGGNDVTPRERQGTQYP